MSGWQFFKRKWIPTPRLALKRNLKEAKQFADLTIEVSNISQQVGELNILIASIEYDSVSGNYLVYGDTITYGVIFNALTESIQSLQSSLDQIEVPNFSFRPLVDCVQSAKQSANGHLHSFYKKLELINLKSSKHFRNSVKDRLLLNLEILSLSEQALLVDSLYFEASAKSIRKQNPRHFLCLARAEKIKALAYIIQGIVLYSSDKDSDFSTNFTSAETALCESTKNVNLASNIYPKFLKKVRAVNRKISGKKNKYVSEHQTLALLAKTQKIPKTLHSEMEIIDQLKHWLTAQKALSSKNLIDEEQILEQLDNARLSAQKFEVLSLQLDAKNRNSLATFTSQFFKASTST